LYDPGFRYSLTGETVNTRDWPPIYPDKQHESHKSVRSSDASTFDFICDDCGATDDVTVVGEHFESRVKDHNDGSYLGS
jgi:hypothetical protein